jgi:tetratricopeptide (TPR) repeat protein
MRKGFVIVASGLALVCTAGAALAQNKKAEALNDEGKDLYSEGKDYEGAAAKFRQAIAIAPDARYYFNLCSALDKLDLYEQALQACDDVFQHKPKPELGQKTGKKAAEIRQRMKAAEAEPPTAEPAPTAPPVPTGDAKPPAPSPPPSAAAPPPRDAKPLDPAMVPGPASTATRPGRALYDRTESSVEREGRYGWALSFEIGPVRNNYDNTYYEKSGLDLKLGFDLMFLQKSRMGLEPYLHFSIFGQRDVQAQKPLSIFDLGAAWFWHIRLGNSSFYFTPMAGLSISFLNPSGFDSSYATAGIRLETALNWVIAERHVVSLGPALTIYPPASQLSGTQTDARTFGLDVAGSTFAVVLGYTYRFDYGWFVGLPLE